MNTFHTNILLLCFTENHRRRSTRSSYECVSNAAYLHPNLASLLDLCLYFFLVLPLPFVNNLPLDVLRLDDKCLQLLGKIMHFQSVS